MGGEFTVRFWGVRGSYPAPGPHTAGIGGNTPCIEVRAAGHLIILDAGTGIIPLGEELASQPLVAPKTTERQPIVATVLFSHTHHDHTQGFPFFKPAYLGASTCYIFGPRTLRVDLEEALSNAMLPPAFPLQLQDMAAMKSIRTIEDSEAIFLGDPAAEPEVRNVYRNRNQMPPDAVKINAHKSYAHPRAGVFVYKITWRGKSLVYATDTEGYLGGDQRLINFARGADVLIHDAQYTEEEYTSSHAPKQGWGHSTPQMAVEVAQAAGVKRLVLFHHEPTHNDAMVRQMEREAHQLFPNTITAYEGLALEL